MTDDSEHDPEGLYKIYKTRRAQSVRIAPAPSDLSDIVPDDELASMVYQHYQKTRNADSLAVDNIMRAISNNTETIESNHPEDQPHPSSADPEVTSNVPPVGRFNWLSRLSGNSDDVSRKFIFPAIAATLFGFFLLPFINSQNNTTDPTIDAAHLSPELMPYIKPATTSMLGFSGANNQQNIAFQYGVLATDLQVLKRGGGTKKQVKLVVQSYFSDTTKEQDQIAAIARRIVTLTADDQASLTIGQEVATEIDSLLNALQEHTKDQKLSDWYALGQSIESVVLSSKHAQSTSDTSVLRSAITHATGTQAPQDDATLKELIDALYSEQITDSAQPSDIRRILSKAEDIKSVLQ